MKENATRQLRQEGRAAGVRRFAGLVLVLAWFPLASAAEPLDFATQVAPVLQKHCSSCHAAGIEKGEFSIATSRDLVENEWIVAGDPSNSYLIDLVTAAEGDTPEMPKGNPPLDAAELKTLREWIAQGATWPEGHIIREPSQADGSWWSLQPIAKPPALPSPAIGSNPSSSVIDRYVLAALQAAGLEMNPPADKATLIRRATYDLTGLPPSPQEVDEFVQDCDPQAYEKLVERLLASPRYGERWGRHWLDVVRFGESNGFERNQIIDNAWPFRDYVIRSLNADKPFDQLIREHLAGDVLDAGNPEVEIGSAFLVLGPYDDVGNQDAEQAAQIRANTLDEMIRTTSEAFLGLTVGCARCHDHKFDPILQSDYYQFYASLSGTRHGSRIVATQSQREAHAARLQPLEQRRQSLLAERDAIEKSVTTRARENEPRHAAGWLRPAADRTGTIETFPPVTAAYVRLVSEASDTQPAQADRFGIDEFEVWTADQPSSNIALAAAGGRASGASRTIEDFPGAYGPQLAIDGKTGARFIAAGPELTIQLPGPAKIEKVIFSSARHEMSADQPKFAFVADYRIEVSQDGEKWTEVAHGRDRLPVSDAHRQQRLRAAEITASESERLSQLADALRQVEAEIAAVPPLDHVWVGNHNPEDARGPFTVFVGGSPQRRGQPVLPASMAVLTDVTPAYQLPEDSDEGERRRRLAEWIVDSENPLTPRVLANRVWHYHFGTGIVATPSDFGFMGERPSHPQLLDWLASQLLAEGWRLKPLHRQIMLSQAYRQSSEFRQAAAAVDGEARLLWRFPPRRLSAEEIRDTLLTVSGSLRHAMGGPGFRLFRYTQDNVATYFPLDEHGPETYRRGVYHQTTRATRTDLMTDFDQPDCAFSTARRAETTTPLQALSTMNHQFTWDMSTAMAERLEREGGAGLAAQLQLAIRLCFAREATEAELREAVEFATAHGTPALCRVLLNTSELIYVK